ncbi:hypothetical protein BJ322DRAFT_1017805 [Thelephora terrestris]|uniref:Uncharacterized protein n=1 Tax=Thelephora terrestris TaxID=56493 RepID=A0A9P6LBV1_9AGAM|nr:hypothetical protein BJ322DRAFT_1017805 [Thelephora terrestris]
MGCLRCLSSGDLRRGCGFGGDETEWVEPLYEKRRFVHRLPSLITVLSRTRPLLDSCCSGIREGGSTANPIWYRSEKSIPGGIFAAWVMTWGGEFDGNEKTANGWGNEKDREEGGIIESEIRARCQAQSHQSNRRREQILRQNGEGTGREVEIITHRLETTRKRAGELSVDDLETLGLIHVLRLSSRMIEFHPKRIKPVGMMGHSPTRSTGLLELAAQRSPSAGADGGIYVENLGFQGPIGFWSRVGPNVVAVKVLGDDGNGQNFDIVHGPNFVAIDFQRTGTPTIAPLSLGGGV